MTVSTDPKHLDRLIDRHVALWEVKRRVSQEGESATRGILAHPSEGPWVTVSKQLGSGGTDLAKKIGERLGWQIFDKQILEAICRETDAKEKILSHLDGRAVGVLEEYLRHLLVPGDIGQPAYVRELVRVIWAIARQGQAILVGRGVNWILEPKFGLRVRTIAPFEQRVEYVARVEGLGVAEARRRVHDDDAGQIKFIRQVFRREVDDPLGYDLMLNLGGIDLATAAETVATALRAKVESLT